MYSTAFSRKIQTLSLLQTNENDICHEWISNSRPLAQYLVSTSIVLTKKKYFYLSYLPVKV